MGYTVLLSGTSTAETASENIDSITSVGEMSEGITSLAEAISDYGPVIVVMAIFFIVFLALVVLVLRSNAKLMNQFMTRQNTSDNLNTNVVTKLVETALSNYQNSSENKTEELIKEFKETLEPLEHAVEELKKGEHHNDGHEHHHSEKENDDESYHHDLVGAFIDVNMAFKDASRKALDKLKCERIAIYVFHNGNNSVHGLPFFKMSCIHEWTTRGCGTLRGKYHTDVPLHLFNDFIENIWKDGYYRTGDVEKSKAEDPSLTEFVSFSNTKALYILGVKDENEKLAGFIIAEFEDIKHFETDEIVDSYCRETLEEMAFKISPVIGTKYIYHGGR